MIFENQELDKIKDYEEYKLFFLIDECNYYITILNETIRNNKDLSEKEKNVLYHNISKVRNIRKHTCDKIKEIKNFDCYKDNAPTDEYLDWWNFWNDWRMSFSDEEWDKIEEKIISDEDIKNHLPK